MKLITVICLASFATITADAQYFKGRGHIYAKQDTASHHLLTSYVRGNWIQPAVTPDMDITSPIIVKQPNSYYILNNKNVTGPALDRINKYLVQKNWQNVDLKPLVHLIYSIYQPGYIAGY